MNKEKLFHIYWGVALVVIPLYVSLTAAFDTRISKDLLSIFLIVISYILFGLQGKVPKGIKFLIISFLTLSFFNKGNLMKSGFFDQFTMMLSFALFGVQFIANTKKKYLYIFLNSLFYVGLTQSIFSILNHFNISIYSTILPYLDPTIKMVYRYSSVGSTGTMGNQNVLGSLIAVCFPLVLSKKRAIFAPIFILGIYFSVSDAPIVASFVGLIIWLIASYSNKISKWLLGIGTTLLYVSTFALPVLFPHIKTTERFENWRKIIEYMNPNKLILGYGPGHLRNNSYLWQTPEGMGFLQAHNEFLEVIFGFGLVGAGILFLITKDLFPKNPILVSILTVGLVNSFFHFTFHISITALILLGAICFNDGGQYESVMER